MTSNERETLHLAERSEKESTAGMARSLQAFILRSVVLVSAGLVLAVLMPGEPQLLAVRALVVVTSACLALGLSGHPRWPLAVGKRDVDVMILAAWMLTAVGPIVLARFFYPAEMFGPLVLTWPGSELRLRTELDVFVMAVLLSAVLSGCHAIRRAARVAGGTALIALALFVGLTVKHTASDVLLLWATDLPGYTRYFLAYDLCSSVWLGALLPLCFVRVLFPVSVIRVLHYSRTAPASLLSSFLLALSPLVVGLAYNSSVLGRTAVDTLPVRLWIVKIAAVLLFTAVYEEIVYRLVGFVAFRDMLDRIMPRRGATMVAALGSSAVFALAHLKQSSGVVLFAAGLGLVYCYVIQRWGRWDFCVAAHTVTTVILLTWN